MTKMATATRRTTRMATPTAQAGIPALLFGQLQSGVYFTDLRISLPLFEIRVDYADLLDHCLFIVSIGANCHLLHICKAKV